MPNSQNPYATPEETASVLSCRSLTNNEQWLEDQLDRISPERHEMGSAGDTIALQKLAFELKTEIDRLRTLADEGFSACDMASASAQGFRDGQMASGVPTSWPCEIVEANFEKNKVTIEMGCTDYVISAGTHYLSKAAPESNVSTTIRKFRKAVDTAPANRQTSVQDALISRLCNARMIAADRLPRADVDAIDEAISALANIRLAETQAMLAAAPEAPAPAQWQELSKEEVIDALHEDGCERIENLYLVGPVQKAAVFSFSDAISAALRAKNGATK